MVVEQEGVIDAQRTEIAAQMRYNYYLAPVIALFMKIKDFFVANTVVAPYCCSNQDLYLALLTFIEPT